MRDAKGAIGKRPTTSPATTEAPTPNRSPRQPTCTSHVVIACAGKARADDEVGLVQRCEQGRDLARIVLAIRIHLHGDRVAVADRVTEPGA